MESISLPLSVEDRALAAAAAASMRAQHRGTDVAVDGDVVRLASGRLDAQALRSAWLAVLITERLIAGSSGHRTRIWSELLG